MAEVNNKCGEIWRQYTELEKMGTDFDRAFEDAIRTGKVEEVKKIQEQIEEKLEVLRSRLYISIEKAQEIMGEDFIGPEDIERVFGMELKQVPKIPFTRKELERAKELDQELVLYIDRDDRGEPLTMQNMAARVGTTLFFHIDSEGLIKTAAWFMNEMFQGKTFIKQIPELGWKLVTREIIPDSVGKDYLDQIGVVIKYLTEVVFKDKALPKRYKDAINEFILEKSRLQELLKKHNEEYGQALGNLQITKLTRESFIEVMYRLVIHEMKNGEKLLGSEYAWTRTLTAAGSFLYLERIGGALAISHANPEDPSHSGDKLGVCCARG